MIEKEEKYREHWPKVKEKLRKDYPFLNEHELEYPMGHESEMMNSLSEKIGVEKQSLMDMLDSFLDIKKDKEK